MSTNSKTKVLSGILLAIIACALGLLSFANIVIDSNPEVQAYDNENSVVRLSYGAYMVGAVSVALLLVGLWLIITSVKLAP